jgi:hypothetical protein
MLNDVNNLNNLKRICAHMADNWWNFDNSIELDGAGVDHGIVGTYY